MTFRVCDFPLFAVTDWRLWFLALMTATRNFKAQIRLTKGPRFLRNKTFRTPSGASSASPI